MNSARGEHDKSREAIEEEAIAWVVRLGDQKAGFEPVELKAWLKASPEHRDAYAWAKRHFDNAQRLKSSSRHGRHRRFGEHGWLIGAALAAAVTAVIAIGSTFRPDSTQDIAQQAMVSPMLRTSPRNIDTFDLADGSRLIMDANSRITVSMDASERRVRVQQGRVRFAVRSDGRPFVVQAGQGEMFTHAGLFDIDRNNPDHVQISVLSGEIDLRGLHRSVATRSYARRAQAGQMFGYRSDEFSPVALFATDIDRRDWPTGWSEYRSVPLGVLVADANRYARRPIRLDDPAMENLLVSGRFRLIDSERFAGRIADLFGLAAVRRADTIHLQRQ